MIFLSHNCISAAGISMNISVLLANTTAGYYSSAINQTLLEKCIVKRNYELVIHKRFFSPLN